MSAEYLQRMVQLEILLNMVILYYFEVDELDRILQTHIIDRLTIETRLKVVNDICCDTRTWAIKTNAGRKPAEPRKEFLQDCRRAIRLRNLIAHGVTVQDAHGGLGGAMLTAKGGASKPTLEELATTLSLLNSLIEYLLEANLRCVRLRMQPGEPLHP